MPFEKGREKTGGRKPGVQNKTTKEIREKIQLVLSGKIDELEADLEKMQPFKQWTILNTIAKYVLPTLNKNDDTVEHTGEININISYEETNALSDNESDELNP